ncbi:MAG: hypothetical protein ACM33T_08120 [Solirubrobacterales bacterium]
MIIGDLEPMVGDYVSVEQKVADLLPEIWPTCCIPGDELPLEDEITKVLVERLKEHPRGGRFLGPIIYQYALLEELQIGDVVTKGIIDIAILLDNDGALYVPFECKRLNLTDARGRVRSLADLYVDEGMMRYVSAKYAEMVPLGVMIGYVMNGDVIKAEQAILHAIEARKQTLRLFGRGSGEQTRLLYKRLITTHAREGDGGFFCIQHTLLPYPCSWPAKEASCGQETTAPTKCGRRRLAAGHRRVKAKA